MLKAGILGAGHFGACHARAIASIQGVRLTAVCDENAQLAHALASHHGASVYDSWRDFLRIAPVDVVVIATPHHLHRDMAVEAAEAGKHILLEKPMACTTAQCTEIISAAERRSVKILVGHLLHFSLSGMVARRIVDSGQLGRPIVGYSVLVKTWIESNRRSWHLNAATGGGMLMTAGIHVLDLLIWLMGAKVSTVSAAAAACFHEQTADDTSMLLLRFADGRLGQVTSIGYREGAGSYGATLVCERGTLRVEFGQGVSIGKNGSWSVVPNSHEADWMQRALEREWYALIKAISDNADVPVTGAYGRHVIACIDAAMQSSREGREVSVIHTFP